MAVLLGLAALAVLHVTIWRMAPSTDPRLGLLIRLALGGVGLSVLVQGCRSGFNSPDVGAVLGIDALAIVGYFFLYAGIARSVSVTLLSQLLHDPNGVGDLETLVKRYAASSRFEDRLELMRKRGLLRVEGATATLTAKGAAVSRRMKVLSQLVCSELRG